MTPIVDPEPDQPGNRFNDGKCDRCGRLFAGTMDDAEVACTGTLYRLDPDRSVHVVRRDVHLSNGLDWSPDDRLMYYTDSPRRLIWAYDYDPARGAMRSTSGSSPACPMMPACRMACASMPRVSSGARIGAAGGSPATRPDGRIDRVLEMPVPQPSSCTFGGPGLATLYVTSAAIGMTEADFARAPEGGGLFAVEVGVRGQPVSRFAG